MGFGVLHRKEIINYAFEISLFAARDVRNFFTSNSFKVHTNTTVEEREAGVELALLFVCLYRFPGGGLLINEHLEHHAYQLHIISTAAQLNFEHYS
jgi:hypothetical protein